MKYRFICAGLKIVVLLWVEVQNIGFHDGNQELITWGEIDYKRKLKDSQIRCENEELRRLVTDLQLYLLMGMASQVV